MDLRQLRYFVELATQQNFGRAASLLHVAQPALSRQIQLLEEEFGVRLFERHARGATPTEEALFLLERASFLLRYADQLKQDMSALQREPRGTVAIGLTPGLALFLSVPFMRAVQDRLPQVRLRIVEGFPPSLRGMLLQGSVDVAVLSAPVELSSLASEPLLTEEICLIGRPGSPPLKGASVSLRKLSGLPLVLTGLQKSGVRLELDAAASNAGVALDPVAEVATLEVAKRLVLEGFGYTVHFAAPIRPDLEAGRLAAVPIVNLRLRRILARAAGRPLSRATEEVIASMRVVIEELVRTRAWPHATMGWQGAAGAPRAQRITAEARRGARSPCLPRCPWSCPTARPTACRRAWRCGRRRTRGYRSARRARRRPRGRPRAAGRCRVA
jgi:LysR family nitrogen assimilation transcriptional regulator